MAEVKHVKGLAELQRMLSQLPAKIQEKSLVAGVSAGAKVVQDAMVARAPVRTDGLLKKIGKRGKSSRKARLPGFLKASIGRKRVEKGSGSRVHYEVGVLRREAWYARLIEFGFMHVAGEISRGKRGGKRFSERVHVPAKPFIRPAFAATQDAAVVKMAERLRSDIERNGTSLGFKG